jgi:Methylamine utilisation protein MauE
MKVRNFVLQAIPLIALVCRLALALIFCWAAIEKIIDPQAFAIAIYYYQLLPDFAINLVALILPMLEMFLALSLVSGIYSRGASLISSLLFLIFATALSINLVRGLDISCGCFGKSSGHINWLYLIRDLSLCLMSLCVLLFDRGWKYFLEQPSAER